MSAGTGSPYNILANTLSQGQMAQETILPGTQGQLQVQELSSIASISVYIEFLINVIIA